MIIIKTVGTSCIDNDYTHPFLFGKILDNSTILYETASGYKGAVNIDVFILDNAPDDDKALSNIFRKRLLYIRLNGQRQALHQPQAYLLLHFPLNSQAFS